jgi:small-conductance mechanosensitive channel
MDSLLQTITYAVIAVALIAGASEALFQVLAKLAKIAGLTYAQLRTFREGYSLVILGIAVAAVIKIAGLSSELQTLTFSGILGLAVSLALQNTLQNIISGMLLFNDKILRVNDLIEFSGVKGTVTRIGLRNAWIREADGTLVVISNSNLSAGPLVNHSAASLITRQHRETETNAQKPNETQ